MVVREFGTAEELWDALSPTKSLLPPPTKLLYRGQADARWPLVPSALRLLPGDDVGDIDMSLESSAQWQVFLELRMLEEFAGYCDRVGLSLPGDSIEFRHEHLNNQRADQFLKDPSRWPNPKLFEVMAFAQHHRVPTRLLDWCRSPYVAVYFAAASALRIHKDWSDHDELAIWVLNTECIHLYSNVVEVVCVPGSVSQNLAAQTGAFTVQMGRPDISRLTNPPGLEEDLKCRGRVDLLKLTLPVWQSVTLLGLCEKVGISAAALMPNADGAALAVQDQMHAWVVERRLRERD